ncbi:ClpP/crotonase [Saccharata proteae CBS 121410]|uniref:ClpP/crotonase n=1 Tax=Saccharata proteae CBS 121410 TaxID=1314787 RepID=A0A9P4I4H7_9PEZI|nr:ClpP/crotonase [Saccharata proteae CBS 121410]
MSSQTYKYEYYNVTFPYPFVALVEINRAQKMNSFIEAMWLSMRDLFGQLSHDPDVRVVVLTGGGDRAFCAGLDVQAASKSGVVSQEHAGTDVGRRMNYNRRHMIEFQECITAVEKCEKPVISILHGYVFGLGIDICTATDIRLSTTNAQFCVKEVDIGIAADIGTLSRLPKAVGSASWVKEVCMSARMFGSEEALRVGLVSNVLKDKQEAVDAGLKMAVNLATKSPIAVMGTKEILNYSRDHSVDEVGLRYVAVWNAGYTQTKDVADALLSGIQKRKPTFEKL